MLKNNDNWYISLKDDLWRKIKKGIYFYLSFVFVEYELVLYL